jgi:hypothetical protein
MVRDLKKSIIRSVEKDVFGLWHSPSSKFSSEWGINFGGIMSSTYIVDRSPNKYGGQQQDYLEQVNHIARETAEAFNTAVESKADLEELFHKTLASLGDARHRIAQEHGTEKADLFGVRRDQEPFPGISIITPLGHPYEEYNQRLMSMLYRHLKIMEHDLEKFYETKSKILEKKCLGRASSIEFEILTYDTLKEWPSKNYFFERYKKLCEPCSIPSTETPFDPKSLRDLMENKDAMQRLKQASIEDYKRLKITEAIFEITHLYKDEGKKSDWVLVTMRSEVEGNMYAFSQYLTWLYRDFQRDPIEKMKEQSIISILHQDPFLIDPMLEDVAKIFKRAIEWKGDNVKVLKNHVALLQYELAHAMPFIRGDLIPKN